MLLLGIVMISTLILRLILVVVIIEMREPMRRRGRWSLAANNSAIVATVLLMANSAIGFAAFDAKDPMPSLLEQSARVFMPFATALAMLLIAFAASMAMRDNREATE